MRISQILKMAALLSLAFTAGSAAEQTRPDTGVVIPNFQSLEEPSQEYALYLPSAWRPETPYPVVFAFDSRDQAAGLAEILAPGAERFGWIVVSPQGSSNLASTEENARRMSVVWSDVHRRFTIDPKRVYALGFSGMSRFACRLAQTAPAELAGVIGLAGGFPTDRGPERDNPFPFVSAVGDRDFAYYEQLDLHARLESIGQPHRLVIYPGSHHWPPPEVATRVLAWMELRAMAEGRRELDESLVAELWIEGMERAEAADSVLDSGREWRALIEDFESLRGVAQAREALEKITESKKYREAIWDSQRLDDRDRRLLERLPQIFSEAGSQATPETISKLSSALGIRELRQRREEHPSTAERLAASRALYAIYIQVGLYAPRRLSEHGEYERALLFLTIAGQIEPGIPQIPFRKALAYAHLERPEDAIRSLGEALSLGWQDRERLETEKAFDSLRDDPDFRAVLDSIPNARESP